MFPMEADLDAASFFPQTSNLLLAGQPPNPKLKVLGLQDLVAGAGGSWGWQQIWHSGLFFGPYQSWWCPISHLFPIIASKALKTPSEQLAFGQAIFQPYCYKTPSVCFNKTFCSGSLGFARSPDFFVGISKLTELLAIYFCLFLFLAFFKKKTTKKPQQLFSEINFCSHCSFQHITTAFPFILKTLR